MTGRLVPSSSSLGLLLCLVVGSSRLPKLSAQCTLSDPVAIDRSGSLLFQQVKDSSAGTYTMKLTYTGGEAWIGIGINTQGRNKMTPANAVIGRVHDDGFESVGYYSLSSESADASGVQPYPSSSIQDATFEQVDGTSTLTFTQDLSEMGVQDDSTWIFAVGLLNNQWAGKHSIDGSFQLALTEDCGRSGFGTGDEDVVNVADPGASGGSDTAGSDEVTGGGTYTDESDDEESGDEVGSAPSSSSSSQVGSGLVVFSTDPYRGLWMAHGIILALAWGLFAPLGIGASLLRNSIQQYLGKSWYPLHFYLNLMTILLTVIGFAIAVVATSKEGDQHFQGETHKQAGLAILILVLLQGLAGYFRPGLPKPPAAADTTTNNSPEASDEEEAKETTAGSSDSKAAASEAPTKSTIRVAWEVLHRLVGVAVLGLAWYNCDSGIELQAESSEESKIWMGAFWGVAAGISGIILALRI